MERIAELLERWDGERLSLRRHAGTGCWSVIAIHSTRLGPARGGTRMKPYPDLDAAVRDAVALAGGMTLKFAAVGFPSGGGKAVIPVPSELGADARAALLRFHGEHVQSLGGAFQTGPDVGTAPADMDLIAERGAPHVFCRPAASGGAGDSGPYTALGVFAAIEAVCDRLWGGGARGRHVAVQGAGSVGGGLVERLVQAGATVTVADVSPHALARWSDEGSVRVVAPEAIAGVDCDVFAPCALGGALNPRSVEALRCAAVVGAANNQLSEPGLALRLKQRDILYAPDFLVNVGGALAITGIELLGWSASEAELRVADAVRENLGAAIAAAAEADLTPEESARALALARLA